MARTVAGTPITGATPHYKFPYPEKDDVHDIAYDIQKLAEAINTAVGLAIPVGSIAGFAASAIPASGWALCDGTNGTPDLRDRFILGASAAHAHGTANAAGHTTTLTALPTHSHTVSFGGANRGHGHGNGTITPSGVSGGGDHTHAPNNGQQWGYKPGPGWTPRDVAAGSKTATRSLPAASSGWMGMNPASAPHGHSFGVPAFASGGPSADHTHGGTLSSAGSSSAFDITPPYYAVVYMMKL